MKILLLKVCFKLFFHMLHVTYAKQIQVQSVLRNQKCNSLCHRKKVYYTHPADYLIVHPLELYVDSSLLCTELMYVLQKRPSILYIRLVQLFNNFFCMKGWLINSRNRGGEQGISVTFVYNVNVSI